MRVFPCVGGLRERVVPRVGEVSESGPRVGGVRESGVPHIRPRHFPAPTESHTLCLARTFLPYLEKRLKREAAAAHMSLHQEHVRYVYTRSLCMFIGHVHMP